MTSFGELEERFAVAMSYRRLRAAHPLVPAARILAYIQQGDGEPFEVFMCPGHEWQYTGTAYGGDDESYHGEGRVYCAHCGADGDA
jgi:hypothetical protein